MSMGGKTGDKSLCEKSVKYKDSCLGGVARTTGDESICPEIKDEFFNELCYQDIAIKHNRIELCAEREKEKDAEHCMKQVRKANPKEKGLIEKATDKVSGLAESVITEVMFGF